MPPGISSKLKYRAYVDGLRAVAVLAVIFYHADLGFSGGYVGVDVFFVISGYLITGVILNELDEGRFRILHFWERRLRRLFPIFALVALSCLVAGWFLYFPADYAKLSQSVLAQVTPLSNVYFYLDSGYFAQGVETKPLLHTWSLAVEEQFYLVLPFILIAFHRRSWRTIRPAILVLFGLSFTLSVYCSYLHPRANFYLLPTRAWELSIGSLLATISTKRAANLWLAESLSWGGLLAILAAVIFYDRDTRFPGAAAALPCFGAALIIFSNCERLTTLGKLLATGPLVLIGLISYSLYLWHWPVLVFFKYWAVKPVPPGGRMLLLLLSMVLALLSWKYLETPVRKRVLLKNRSQFLTLIGTATAALVFSGVAIHELNGVPSRIPAQALHYLEGTSMAKGCTNPVPNRLLSVKDVLAENLPEFGATNKVLSPELLVWGDSHAQMEIPALDILCKQHSVRAVAATHSQTAPLTAYQSHGEWSLNEDSEAFNNAVIEYIRSHHVSNVFIAARWDFYITTDKGTDSLRHGMVATLSALQSSGARIWIMRQVPKYDWDVPKALASAVLHGQDPELLGRPLAEQRAESKLQDPIFEGLASQFPGVTVLDPTGSFVDAQGRCRVTKNGKALYLDADHLTVAGAVELLPIFAPMFGDAVKGTLLTSKVSAIGKRN